MNKLIGDNFTLVVEMLVLLAVFVIGAAFLAHYPQNQQLASWIEGGTIIGVLARALGGTSTNGKETK